jgi:hypothetical protein
VEFVFLEATNIQQMFLYDMGVFRDESWICYEAEV